MYIYKIKLTEFKKKNNFKTCFFVYFFQKYFFIYSTKYVFVIFKNKNCFPKFSCQTHFCFSKNIRQNFEKLFFKTIFRNQTYPYFFPAFSFPPNPWRQMYVAASSAKAAETAVGGWLWMGDHLAPKSNNFRLVWFCHPHLWIGRWIISKINK